MLSAGLWAGGKYCGTPDVEKAGIVFAISECTALWFWALCLCIQQYFQNMPARVQNEEERKNSIVK